MGKFQFEFFFTPAQLADLLNGVAAEHGATIVALAHGPDQQGLSVVSNDDLADFVARNKVSDLFVTVGAPPGPAGGFAFRKNNEDVGIEVGRANEKERDLTSCRANVTPNSPAVPLFETLKKAVKERSNKGMTLGNGKKVYPHFWEKSLSGWTFDGYRPLAQQSGGDASGRRGPRHKVRKT